MKMITIFNTAVSDAINKDGDLYTAYIGTENFTPNVTIEKSADFNCGAICNELEFLRLVSESYVKSLDIYFSEDKNLERLVNSFISLPRYNRSELDEIYRNRFLSIAVEKNNPRRTTPWAIRDSLSQFIDPKYISVVEKFDTKNMYFEVRITGVSDDVSTIFLTSTIYAFIDQNFIGGDGIGGVVTFIGDIVERVKAAGVDFDIIFVTPQSFQKPCNCFVGVAQMYRNVKATIKGKIQKNVSVDAEIN